MSYQCLMCDRQASYRYACRHCVDEMRRWLRELEDYTVILVATMGPLRDQTIGSLGATFGSQTPARDDVVTLLDYRSGGGTAVFRLRDPRDMDDDPIRSLPGSIHGIACWLREEREETEPRSWDLVSELRYLRGQVEACSFEQWVNELYDDLRELHHQARSAAHDQPPGDLGQCLSIDCEGLVYRATLRDSQGEHEGGRCSNQNCRREYTGLDFVRLRGHAEQAS